MHAFGMISGTPKGWGKVSGAARIPSQPKEAPAMAIDWYYHRKG